MNLETISKIVNYIIVGSLIGVIAGLAGGYFGVTIISLLIFCLTGNISTTLSLKLTLTNIEAEFDKLARLQAVSDLLKGGVF